MAGAVNKSQGAEKSAPILKGETHMKMTKTALVDAIEKSGLVADFDRKYLMRKSKSYLVNLYNHCQTVKGLATI